MRGIILFSNGVITLGVTLHLCTVWVPQDRLIGFAIACLLIHALTLKVSLEKPPIMFAMTSWWLATAAYGVLAIGGFMGGFGRLAPLELVFSPAAMLCGLMAALASARVAPRSPSS